VSRSGEGYDAEVRGPHRIFRTTSLPDVLALPRTTEITMLDTIRLYGIVMREPARFSEGLSPRAGCPDPEHRERRCRRGRAAGQAVSMVF